MDYLVFFYAAACHTPKRKTPHTDCTKKNMHYALLVTGGGDAWSAAFDNMAERGLVKTTLDLEERPLDERLLAVQELYDFSAAGGYRTGKPDGDDDDGAIGGRSRNDAVREEDEEKAACSYVRALCVCVLCKVRLNLCFWFDIALLTLSVKKRSIFISACLF